MPRTLDTLSWPYRTERLVLRQVTPGDADVVWELKGDPELNRWTTRLYRARADFDADWERRAPSDVVAHWDGRLAGVLMVKQADGWGQAEVAEQVAGQEVELGWTVASWAQGQGVATELARAGLDLAFSLGVHRVVAQCFADNVASWKVMEKIGMRRETHGVKDSLHRDGQWLDSLVYALLAEEYALVSSVLPSRAE